MSMDKGPRDDRWYFSIMAPNTKGVVFFNHGTKY